MEIDVVTLEGVAPIERTLAHALSSPRVVWVPHLTPEEGHVIGDAVFRAPAIVLADDTHALAFIVDVDDVANAQGSRAYLDYDHTRGLITLGAGSYREDGHVFYRREAMRDGGARVSLRMHVLKSGEVDNPYGVAARWLWERWGRPNFARGSSPPLSRFMDYIVRWAFSSDGWGETVWHRVGAPVFIVDVGRHPSVPADKRTWREPPSVWNQAWFSTQRCANGLLRHARHGKNRDLEERARKMTEIALSAPERDGLFPAVLCLDGMHWTNSDRRPSSVPADACHLVDAAFTSRMLLEWHALTGDARARDRALRFADRAVTLQRPSGAFPGWVDPTGPELAEGPESAVTATLLFELGRIEPALRAVDFLEGVAREGRWEDFETYYSCARWGTPGERVPRNGVYKQNTLSIAWTAEAFWHAYRATNEDRYRRLSRRCLDELSLYQAVWDPPFLAAPAHGGFGVMNADSEWNDARQSLFAPLYLELGRALHDRELTERGISALYASFSMLYCPENAALARAYERRFPFFGPESYGFMMENQGHSGAEPVGTFTIFTWGNGSALATAATVRDLYPEVSEACGLR